jgi:hypothetical protein
VAAVGGVWVVWLLVTEGMGNGIVTAIGIALLLDLLWCLIRILRQAWQTCVQEHNPREVLSWVVMLGAFVLAGWLWQREVMPRWNAATWFFLLVCVGLAPVERISNWVAGHWPHTKSTEGIDGVPRDAHCWVITTSYTGVTGKLVVGEYCVHCDRWRTRSLA